METQEVEIGQQSVIDVQLGSDVKQLTEVVVTGSGIATDKKKLGISVESITADKLPATPTASIDQALVGKIAGAQISSISGNPGDPVQILLRGINSVQGGTKPMILVDGVQVVATDINSLDLSNIDRVEVVQGAAGGSIFGAQGANGVIQVFTKKGKIGGVVINFSSSYAINQCINVNNNLGKANLHPYLTDANNNLIDLAGNLLQYSPNGDLPGISYRYGGATRYAIVNPNNIANTPYDANIKFYDHFTQMFHNGSTLNNNINISGAGEKMDYSISINNNRTVSPVLQNGEVDRTNLTVNVGTELAKGFKLRSTTQVVYTKNTMVPGLGAAGGFGYGAGNGQGNISGMNGFLNTSPFFDLNYKQPDGMPPAVQIGGGYLSVNSQNPLYIKEYASGLDNKIDVVQSFDANYTVNKFIELDAKYGINYRTENARWLYLNQSQNLSSNTHTANNFVRNYNTFGNTGEVNYFTYTNSFQNFLGTAYIRINFQDDLKSKLPIETSTQISFDYRNKKYTETDVAGIGLPLVPPFNLSTSSTQIIAPSVGPVAIGQGYYSNTLGLASNGDMVVPFVTYGYLVNQKINYGNYGGITAGFRSDWSSSFGGGHAPFTFPHADVFILPSTFWKDKNLEKILPYFKIRSAYGQAGIQPYPFDRYPTFNIQTIGTVASFNFQTTPQNPNLKVEVSTEKEIGADFTVNTNPIGRWFTKINGAFTYWTRSSANVIYAVPQNPSGGSPLSLTNAIGMASNGTQFSINLPVYQSAIFTWDLTANWSQQISKITSIAGGADITLTSSAGSTALVLHPGAVIGQINGHKAITSTADPELVAYNNKNNLSEADYSIVDGRVVLNSTKQIQFSQKVTPLGNPNPKFNTSFINSFGYKNFLTFTFQFDWVYGSHLYNQNKEWMYRDGTHKDFTKPVTINGQTGAYTAYWSSPFYNLLGSPYGPGNNGTKDYFMEDASFWRLRNISMAFDLAKITNINCFKKLQLVLTGRNLLTFTKYSGADPEVSSTQVNSSFDRGVENGVVPNLKSYQAGINITF